MANDALRTAGELIRKGLLVSFRIEQEEVLHSPGDEVEFGMRVRLRFVADDGEADLEEEDVAEDTAEWGSFGFLFTLAVLSFAEAKPRGYSEADYQERDDFSLSDFMEHLRFVRGALRFDADYIRGRRIKTRMTVRSDGTATLETIERGKSVLRWLERVQGKQLMQLIKR